jgi:hypothetical protein
MTRTPSNISDEQRAEALQLLRRAFFDPGAFVPRGDDYSEPLPAWAARAAMAALDAHPLLEIRPYHPTRDAYTAADKAVWAHLRRAEEAEAERDYFAAAVQRVGQVQARLSEDGEAFVLLADLHAALKGEEAGK